VTEHPLGVINGTEPVDSKSIVDQVLDLDEFLSADVRLATTEAAWYIRPDMQAEIEHLNAELDSLTDSQGRPLVVTDESMADGERSAKVVTAELLEKQKEYASFRRVIIMQQLDEDDWTAFQEKWKDELKKNPPYVPAFYEELIIRCAIRPTINVEQLRQLRKRVGAPVFEELWGKAWAVNTRSGVSIPKSWLSSNVQRQQQPG
jgi:hypothetical protein